MYRKSIYLFMVNSINRVLNFFLKIVLRSVLGSTGFGTIAVILPIQNLILTITSYAISPSVSKHVSEDDARGEPSDLYPFTFILLGIALFVFGYAIAPGFASFLSEDFGQQIITPLRIMFLMIPFGVTFSVLTGIYFGRQMAKRAAYALFIVQASTVVFSYALGYSMSVEGAVFSFMIAYILGTLYLLAFYRKGSARLTFNLQRGLSMLRFSLPILVTSFAIVTIFQIDIVVLGRYFTTDETSIYGLVTPTARLVPAFSVALSMMLLPRLSSLKATNAHEEIDRTFNKAFDVGFTISLPFMFLIFSFSKEILYVLFDSVTATSSLRVLSVGMFFYSLYYLLSSAMQGIGKPKIPMYILSACAVADIALCFILIPRFSLLGAASATSLSMFLAFALMFAYVRPKKVPSLLNLVSILPLLVFERLVGVIGGRYTTVSAYLVVGLIYILIYIKYNGILEVLRDE